MKSIPMCGSNARSLDAARPIDINALLGESIQDQINQIIQQHPHCPPTASMDVDGLLLTLEGMGGGDDI